MITRKDGEDEAPSKVLETRLEALRLPIAQIVSSTVHDA
jgi:hypothetical protein